MVQGSPINGKCNIVRRGSKWYVVNKHGVNVSHPLGSYGEAVVWARGEGYTPDLVFITADDRPIGRAE